MCVVRVLAGRPRHRPLPLADQIEATAPPRAGVRLHVRNGLVVAHVRARRACLFHTKPDPKESRLTLHADRGEIANLRTFGSALRSRE